MFRASLIRLPALVTYVVSITIGALLSLLLHDVASIPESLRAAQAPHSLLYKDWLQSRNVSLELDLSSSIRTEFNEVVSVLLRAARLMLFVCTSVPLLSDSYCVSQG